MVDKKDKKTKSKNRSVHRFVLFSFLLSFLLTVVFTYIADRAIGRMGYSVSFLVLAFFIFLGIVFDMIGTATAFCDESVFHSMAARKVPGSKEATWMAKNAEKVTSFCNDIVGDISGIISGATGATIIVGLARDFGLSELMISLPVTGLIAALVIGGKAAGKTVAREKSSDIVLFVSRILHFFNLSRLRKDQRSNRRSSEKQ